MALELWPLVGREALVRAFRPGESPSREGPFRTLRKHHYSTAGVQITTRSQERAAGTVTFFSTLNVEAARLARQGKGSAARRVARAASALESGPEFKRLSARLAGADPALVAAVLDGTYQPGDVDIPWALFEKLVRKTSAAFRRITSENSDEPDVFIGCVGKVAASTVTIQSPKFSSLVPRELLRSIQRDRPGACLSIWTEWLEDSKAAYVFVLPAVDLDLREKPKVFDPFARSALAAEITREDAALLSRRPEKLKILVPVSLG